MRHFALPLLAIALVGAAPVDNAATAAPVANAATAAPVDDAATAARLRDAALTGNAAYDLVKSLTTEVGPRLAGSQEEARARAWAVTRLKALGFSNVRIEPFDMPAWERGTETATIVAPFPQKLVVSALGNSGATPAAGLTAEVVRFDSVDALQAAPDAAVRGRIVFVTHRMMRTQDGSSYGYFNAVRTAAPALAAAKGAAAILIRSLGTDYHRNPHTGMTRWSDGLTPIAAAALSVPDSEQLERVLDYGRPVRIHLTLTPRFAGTARSGNVIAEIPGSTKRDQIVLIGGHLDSWDLGTGAVDDGAGIAVTTAAAKLILDHRRPPQRTIRLVLFGAEEVGLLGAKAYAAKHGAASHALVAEADFGAGRVWRLGSHVAPEALPAVKSLAAVLAPLGVMLDARNDARCGSDIAELTKLGVACIALVQNGHDYFDLHHTPDDTLDKIDPRALDQVVASYAALTWIAANADVAFGPVAP